jgi:hypothetical protein
MKWSANGVRIENHRQIDRGPKRDCNLESIHCKKGRIRQQNVTNDRFEGERKDLRRNDFPDENGIAKIFVFV